MVPCRTPYVTRGSIGCVVPGFELETALDHRKTWMHSQKVAIPLINYRGKIPPEAFSWLSDAPD